MKKIISLFLTLFIVVGALVIMPVGAEEIDKTVYTSKDGKYKYRFEYEYFDVGDEGDVERLPVGVSILGYIGKKPLIGKYVVPQKIDGHKVSAIGEKAFMGSKIKKLVIKYEWITVYKKAFYNCTSLKRVCISQNAQVYDKAFGYYYDEKAKAEKKVEGFSFRIREEISGIDYGNNLNGYAYNYNCKTVFYLDSSKPDVGTEFFFEPGFEFYIKIDERSRKGWKTTNDEVVSVTNDGKVKILDYGKATVKVKLSDGTVFKRTIMVNYSFNIWDTDGGYNNRYNKDATVKVKKGKIAKLVLNGKVNSIKNVYTNTSKAKFVNTKLNNYLKIKGLKKGKTTLKVRVNGVKTVKIKVKVI